MGRKKKYCVDLFASLGGRDNFGTVYASMILSDAFQNLSKSAKLLYIYCRVESQTQRAKQSLYNHHKEERETFKDNYFVFPASHLKDYGLDRCNASRDFKELAKSGFIEYVERNKTRRKVNIYAFSNKWKDNDTS